jgi:heat-inducible transcriptional repressor
MMDLDTRKQVLLQTIVLSYVDRAEPVGSHFLASQEGLGVRSATIRNELAEMTDLGLLRQPHTSAGRIPSDMGYRYYVDRLMPAGGTLAPGAAGAIRGAQRISEGDLEQLLIQTCRVLSSLTRYTTVATPPTSGEPVIRQVHLVAVTADRLLAVVVLDNGQVIHRFCDPARRLSTAEVTRLSNALDTHLRGVAASAAREVPAPGGDMAGYEDLFRLLLGVIERGAADEEGDLVVEGASHILEQPEFRDANRVEPLIRFLEERKNAFETLRRVLADRELAVSIGRENLHESMHEVSMVSARYSAGSGAAGWVAVIGPTRMHYTQATAAVRYAAALLTETLSALGTE